MTGNNGASPSLNGDQNNGATREQELSPLAKSAEDLFAFSIEREDTHFLLTGLPENTETPRHTIEYELQLLKIISTGWAISYFLGKDPVKEPLSELFWGHMFTFSENLSETTGLMIGKDIDYFRLLKERLDVYVSALSAKQKQGDDPAGIVGPEFAKACGAPDDIFIIMLGTKMFAHTIGRVRDYLTAALEDIHEYIEGDGKKDTDNSAENEQPADAQNRQDKA